MAHPQYTSPHSPDALAARLSRIRHVALDMDGTIYLGGTLFPFTAPFLESLRRSGISYSFLTNNPSESVVEYSSKLKRMGIDARQEEIYTSALAAIGYIKRDYPQVRRLFILGTPAMSGEFEQAGFVACRDSAEDRPDMVVVGFDKTLEYSRLCRAAWWIKEGLPYVATNPDLVCPTDQPTVLVDCGSICACIEAATGRKPDKTLGKPDPDMLSGIIEREGLEPAEIAMVGDRLYTDIAMARDAGAFGVLVLSGETTAAEASAAARQPDLTVKDISVLGELLVRPDKNEIASSAMPPRNDV